MTQRCKACDSPAVALLPLGPLGEVPVCEHHALFVRNAGRELAHTGARVLGEYMRAKAPKAMAAGATIFQALRTAAQTTSPSAPGAPKEST